MTEKTTARVKKSEITRQKIVDAAIQLFEENGYEQATMRAVAQRAGVSLGNAYYYFSSKEDLIQAYYANLFDSFSLRAADALLNTTTFSERMKSVLTAWVDNASPYHEFAGHFFRHAADPKSPLSPFSDESSATREASIDLYRSVIEGSKRLRVSPEVKQQLPQLLWLYQMGIVLYWVHDPSENQANTYTLIDKTVPLVSRLIGLSALPGLRSVAGDLMKLVSELGR